MVNYYVTIPGAKGLIEIERPQKNCWIHAEAPTAEEAALISALTGISENLMKSALDEEETAHIDVEGKAKLIVIDIPKKIEDAETGSISTIPLTLICTDEYLVSVCTATTHVLNDFFEGKVKNVDTAQRPKLAYQIMYNNSVRFLYYLRQIDRASDRIQKSLSKSMKNEELLQLVDLQKTLVFFSAALTANYAVTQRIYNMVKLDQNERDALDILDDVTIENRQALEMCSIYREIIKGTLDAFAAIVNNNQNIVMKFLTAITILLSIPMVVAGFWGMNTEVPFEGKLWGFWVAVGVALVISVVIAIFMARKKMF